MIILLQDKTEVKQMMFACIVEGVDLTEDILSNSINEFKEAYTKDNLAKENIAQKISVFNYILSKNNLSTKCNTSIPNIRFIPGTANLYITNVYDKLITLF